MRYAVVRGAGAILLGVTMLVAGGCGFKNKPVAPESVVPQAIEDLRYTIGDKGAQLTWSFPVKTVRGSVVEEISSFDLYRAEIPLDSYCATCPVPFLEPVKVDGGASVDGKLRRKATFVADHLRSGHKYFYKVRSRTSWLADSPDSNIISFVWFDPAPAPAGVTATPGDNQVTLVWQPVTLPKGGADMAVRYQVQRSGAGKDYAKVGEPVAVTNFVDRQVNNGQKYNYTVQAVTVYKNEIAEGGTSKEVTVTPVDLAPPAPPTGVTAVRTDAGIKVFWDRSSAADLAGYRVYRRAAEQDALELVGKVAPEFTIYVDAKAGENVRYYYAITAIDNANPANESGKSKEATVRY